MNDTSQRTNNIIKYIVRIVIIVLLVTNIILIYSIFNTPPPDELNDPNLCDLEYLEYLDSMKPDPDIDLTTYTRSRKH